MGDDRLNSVCEKREEYKSWGVPYVWLIDAHSRRMYTCGAGFTEVPSLRIPELDLEVTPSEIFE
ncbi:MAG: Uma2 family endonuclease [Acidobacteriota bacterium]|nr:Uma2 family endonuclease [Acidobacteriota bacterium]